jgi:hypothetical protein
MTTKQRLLKSWPYWLGLPMVGIAINIGRFWMDERHMISKQTHIALGFMIWIAPISGMMVMMIKNECDKNAEGEAK